MKLESEKLKMIGGAIVIAAAFAIMMPGFLTYFAYLGKLVTYIAIVLAGVIAVGLINMKIIQKKKERGVSASSTPKSPTEES